MKITRSLWIGLAMLALAGSARAQFIVTALTSTATFGPSDPVITFDTLAQDDVISTQYLPQGLNFSAGLIASTNGGDTNLFPSNGGGVIATNWVLTGRLDTWTITFTVPQTRVVFLVEMNSNDNVQLTTSLNSITHGSVSRTSPGITPQYFGVEDLNGFDSLSFTVTGTNNHFFAMDSFQYQAVPEPAPWVLFGLGLAGVGAVRRWRQRTGKQGT